MAYIIGIIIWGIIWGFATNAVIHGKGYDENWFWWGFFFGFIALIVAACKPENRSGYQSYSQDSNDPYSYFQNNSADAAYSRNIQTKKILDQGGWMCSCGRLNESYIGTCACGRSKSDVENTASNPYVQNNSTASMYANDTNAQKILAQGGWACVCGRLNESYIGTCACGRTKAEIEEINRRNAEQEKSSGQDELSKLAAIKELKSLLDEGIITQEEFDAKKKNLLGI